MMPGKPKRTLVRRLARLALVVAACALAVAVAKAQKAPASQRPERRPEQRPARVELNAATAAQLEELPGVGPMTAEAIVRFREKSGPFRRVEDLLAIRGISRRRLEELRPLVTVAPPKDS